MGIANYIRVYCITNHFWINIMMDKARQAIDLQKFIDRMDKDIEVLEKALANDRNKIYGIKIVFTNAPNIDLTTDEAYARGICEAYLKSLKNNRQRAYDRLIGMFDSNIPN